MQEFGPVRNIVIVGGGTAGWMAAAAAARFLKAGGRTITLVESESIGTVGVGEATIPPILEFNRQLEIPEQEFLRETKATYKLGIEFVGWRDGADRYFHPFGHLGRRLDGLDFHQLWLKLRKQTDVGPLVAYSMSGTAALNGRFAPPIPDQRSLLAGLAYAYHFDAGLYARFLRRYAERRGIQRTEGRIVDVEQDGANGHVTAVRLDDGQRISGELFIDCSGFRSLLLGQTMGVPFIDWSHWLPCDRAIAVPTERREPLLPYTRSTAHGAGWQWRIPLQHRTGNGHVYSSAHLSDDEAERILVTNLDSPIVGDFNRLKFAAGRRERCWAGNVVGIGLSSGFLEPLESTSIHLIQHGIQRLFSLFPDAGFSPLERDEYNRFMQQSYDSVRDFIILHYKANARSEPFWRHAATMDIPDSLQRKLDLFADKGRVFRYSDELFELPSWVSVMIGQGIEPRGYDPLVDGLDTAAMRKAVLDLRNGYSAMAQSMPTHGDFIGKALGGPAARRMA